MSAMDENEALAAAIIETTALMLQHRAAGDERSKEWYASYVRSRFIELREDGE